MPFFSRQNGCQTTVVPFSGGRNLVIVEVFVSRGFLFGADGYVGLPCTSSAFTLEKKGEKALLVCSRLCRES